MSSTSCHHCGCSEIDRDPARGDAVCTGCGSVLEDNIIVSEVQFEENHLGGTAAVGQFVSSEGKSTSLSGTFHRGSERESRVLTLHKARKRIVQLAQQLRLNQNCIDTTMNFFKMAMVKKITRGRRRIHIIAACVYMVCRLEGTAHMLLDLSDIVQVNVYQLGKTFLYLTQALCINIPPIDPCLYILRFAHKLEFGDKTHDVYMTALRLVQRMKRDWMHTGRRPSGLCGAALLVAARLHDFSRTTKDIIKVVKVCEATLKKRLNEFGETPSSHLTLDEFMSIDLEEEQDPPAYKRARKRAKFLQFEDTDEADEMTQQITVLESQIEKALEEHRRKIKGPYAKCGSTSDEVVEEPNVDDTNLEKAVAEETLGAIQEFLSQENVDAVVCADTQTPERVEIVLTQEKAFQDPLKGLGPTSASLGLKESIAECMKINPAPETVDEDGELDLTGIDDKELEYYIMNEKEVERKTDLWNKVNAEYLQEQKEKEEREAKEKEEGIVKPEKKKRKVTKRKSNVPANTAGEAIEKMLQERRISNKINYDVLRNLNKKVEKDEALSTVASQIEMLSNTPSSNIPEGTLASRLAPTILASTKSFNSDIPESKTKRLTSILKNDGLKRRAPATEDAIDIDEVPMKIPKTDESEVVLESDPIQYEDENNLTDEEFEDEDGHISAAKLFGRTDDNDYDEYADYDCDDT